MELEKLSKSAIAELNGDMQTLVKLHQQVVSFPELVAPKWIPKNLMIGKCKTETLDNGNTISIVEGIISMAMVSSLVLPIPILLFDRALPFFDFLLVLGGVAAISNVGAANIRRMGSGKSSIGYFMQKAWRKIGLPTRGLDRKELQYRLSVETYAEQYRKREKALAKARKKSQIAIDSLNDSSQTHVYEFTEHGVKSTVKPQLSSIMKAIEESTLKGKGV